MKENGQEAKAESPYPFKTGIDEIPEWHETLSGLSYNPFRPGQSPHGNVYPTPEQIREDLLLIRPLTRHIRTYSIDSTLACIPEIAEELDMSVTLGVWITGDKEYNRRQLADGVKLANRLPSVKRLLLGNEALRRGDVSLDQLIDYLKLARGSVSVPVSTSEPWRQWHETPELAEHCDFIAACILPFRESVLVTEAASTVVARADELKRAFPEKAVILFEIGWPGKGNVRRRITTYRAEQAVYLRTQLALLEEHGYRYFVKEAFDQPWKAEESLSAPHWGLFDATRRLKPVLRGPLTKNISWSSKIPGLATRIRPDSWRTAVLPLAVICGLLVWAGMNYTHALSTWIALPLVLAWAVSLMIAAGTETHEFVESCWGPDRQRSFPPQLTYSGPRPKVSIHLPCYNEPPDMVKLTLDSLQQLEYPDFEVLIIDNNTQDPAIWKPVEQHCHQLGPRFRFFHVTPLTGYKAGALNYLLNHTADDAEIVAVIDSDYCVHPLWLRHMTPYFSDPDIAVIQVMQDYRDGDESLFKRCCKAEYRVFFKIGMVVRNDHNAISQHGTMTLIRRSVIEHLRWAEWCVCEDAELGLRILDKGLSMGYAPVSYGKGLTPDTFLHFKKQRYRWAYGVIQIVKRNTARLMAGKGSSLSRVQRYHFIAGWLPWMTAGADYVVSFAMLLWSVLMIVKPDSFGPLPWIFSFSALLYFVLRTSQFLILYRRLMSTNTKEALAALLAGIALHPTIGRAVVSAVFTSRLPFFRTPKHTSGTRLGQAILEARGDLCVAVIFLVTIVLLCSRNEIIDMDLFCWIAILSLQLGAYMAALVMAVLSARATRPTSLTK